MTADPLGEMAMAVSCQGSSRPSTCPPWLQAALADIEQRVQSLALNLPPSPEESNSDSFAERAENYYEKRPQLISLIQDLHNRYLLLADRYTQSILKINTANNSSSSAALSVLSDSDDDRPPLSSISTFSDPDISSLRYPDPVISSNSVNPILVELTISLVERDILLDELTQSDRRQHESNRKMELQRSLLEVMESERVVLVAENARLDFRAAAAAEERMRAEAEAGHMRRRAAELAERVGMMREDRRVWDLGRRIEALQRQVAGMARRERERERVEAMRVELERLREENRRLRRRSGWVRWWVSFGGTQGIKAGNRSCCYNPCFCL